MQELRLVAVSEDGTYLVLATAGRGTRFTLPVDDRLRAAVRGNFSRLGQYEIEVESPLRPKEIQARIRAGETAEEIAATAGIPVERVRWFEGPVLQEREYVAQQAQRVAVRLPGENTPRPTLGELVAERLTRRGVPADEIDWDSCKRDDNLWRIKLGFVWNGHTRHAEWLFDPRRRHITPYDDEAMRLSAAEYVDPPQEEATVRPFVPRLASKLAPVPSFEPRFEPEPVAPYAEPGGFTDPTYPETAYLQPPPQRPAYTDPTPLPAPQPVSAPVRPAAFHPEPIRQEPSAPPTPISARTNPTAKEPSAPSAASSHLERVPETDPNPNAATPTNSKPQTPAGPTTTPAGPITTPASSNTTPAGSIATPPPSPATEPALVVDPGPSAEKTAAATSPTAALPANSTDAAASAATDLTTEPATQAAASPTPQATATPTPRAATNPAAEPITQAVAAAEPDIKAVTNPAEPVTPPASEATTQAVPDPTPEPAAQPAAALAAEPTPEPAAEPTTIESTPKPEPIVAATPKKDGKPAVAAAIMEAAKPSVETPLEEPVTVPAARVPDEPPTDPTPAKNGTQPTPKDPKPDPPTPV
ncbi:septation protein SepH, partial [Acrocarpospora sp. B8E8]|uniref:septation protein SepH n=1 Tax=Acrocarpospora sp. B8E8 TaxID=3153572 RepID=UPI00325CE40F